MKDFDAGTFVNKKIYKSFIPSEINRKWMVFPPEVLDILSTADYYSGKLKMLWDMEGNDALRIMFLAKESIHNVRIESNACKIEELFMDKKMIPENRQPEQSKVKNVFKAFHTGISHLNDIPFSDWLIKLIHRSVMQEFNDSQKMPGEYRRKQNVVGGSSVRDAMYIPPPPEKINSLMLDHTKFCESTETCLPTLIKTAVLQYQMESIHPFIDGNGRTSRIIANLYQVYTGSQETALFCLSAFYEKNRNQYFERMMRVRSKNDIKNWVKFFLSGIIERSEEGIMIIQNFLKLQEQEQTIIKKRKRLSKDIQKVFEFLHKNPVIDTETIRSITAKSHVSAYNLTEVLRKSGFLTEITGNKKGRIYIYKKYLDIFNLH